MATDRGQELHRAPHRGHIVAGLVLAMIVGAGSGAARADDAARAVVQRTIDAVLVVVRNQSLTSEQKRHEIEQVVYTNFDFQTLSRLVLARNWKRLTPAQQTQFVDEFKKHLSLTYGRNLDTYNNERAEITGERQEPGGDWSVKTTIIRPNAASVLVDYRLRRDGDRWQVIDVIIEGVSLVANFRSQFQAIMSNDGADKLIQLLHDKNVKGEPLKSA